MTLLLWLLLLGPLIAAWLVQKRLLATFTRYRAVANRVGLTGAELARILLDVHGLRDVKLELAPGFLSDHYDGANRVLRLSEVVARERSVAALGIAGHEVSHAYQDAEGSRSYRLRKKIAEPLGKLAPWSGFFFIGGFWLGIPLLMIVSIVYVAGLVLFALVTLPVEIGASHRALELLRAARLADTQEIRGVRSVLAAAAWTYVVGLLNQVGLFLVLVVAAEMIHGVTT
ncbi:MAG TPA: zinc metallopeptidase [Solirubrobacter sp.]|jgi:Zn-dependent membrane protease YugP|nr:zinc metallopeptidase [Solirubrobacter sp.]